MMIRKKHRTESFDSLFRRFKKGVEKKDIINEVRKREHYVKFSMAKESARKSEQKRQQEQDTKRIPV